MKRGYTDSRNFVQFSLNREAEIIEVCQKCVNDESPWLAKLVLTKIVQVIVEWIFTKKSIR